MRKALLIPILICLLVPLIAQTWYRIDGPTPADIRWAAETGLDIAGHRTGEYLDIIGDNTLQTQFLQRGLRWTTMTPPRDIDGYLTLEEMSDSLDAIAASYPDFATIVPLGPSTCHTYLQGGNDNYADYPYTIRALKLSDNPQQEEDEPNVFLAGGIHAREVISAMVVFHILDHLVENYGTDPFITHLINDSQIWILPMMNPDGTHLVLEQIATGHRKSLSDNNENGIPDTSGDDGVDLNRNFGYVWGDNGASNNPGSSIYHGTGPFSELESVYARDMILPRCFWGGITYHSAGEYVLYPLGHLNGACSYDHEIMHDLASAMAAVTPRISGSGHYTPRQAVDFGYTCQGTMGDWGYASERLFTFTIELASQFLPCADDVPVICQDNLQGALMFLERPHRATITGHVTDSGGIPLTASVHVAGIDDAPGMSEVEPARSQPPFGRYIRPLLPGTYTLSFSAPGYATHIAENVTVTDSTVTVLDIALEPSQAAEDNTLPNTPQVYPNPCRAGQSVSIRHIRGHARFSLYNIRGQQVLQQFLEQENAFVIPEDFPPGFYLYRLQASGDGDPDIRGRLLITR